MTIYFGDGSSQTAGASGGFWTTLHEQLHTANSSGATHLVTGLGGYDMLRLFYTVTCTGSNRSDAMPRMKIGTSSGLNTDEHYQSRLHSGIGNLNNGGGQTTYWIYETPNGQGDPGNDYSAVVLSCDMQIFNWQGNTYHTIGHYNGGYTSSTNQNTAQYFGSLAHRGKNDWDRIEFSWANVSSTNVKKFQLGIHGANYS